LLTDSFDIPEASSEVIDVIFRKLFKALKKRREKSQSIFCVVFFNMTFRKIFCKS
jgi:hypothetical protein